MRRIYFLVPDHDTTKKIVDELLLARIEERHIHVIAKEAARTPAIRGTAPGPAAASRRSAASPSPARCRPRGSPKGRR